MLTRRRTDQSGAVAVVVALMAFLLFALAALVVDLGNGFVRKRDTQNQADFSALAGGSELPGTGNTPSPGDNAVIEAAQYLEENQPADDNGPSARYSAAELVTMLTDSDPSNGQAYYGHFDASGNLVPDRNELTVVTPPRLVKFGLAGILGANAINVQAKATVGIYSPGTSIMPTYAVSGCDQGPQTLTDPANGQVTPTGPNLADGLQKNKASLDAPGNPPTNPSPAQVSVNPAAGTLIIKGNGLANMTKVGFFQDGGATEGPAPIVYDLAGPNTNNNQITIPLPIAGVTDQENLWWIRIWGPASGGNPDQWSAVYNNNGTLNTVPFRVGTPYLECSGASNQGNFGTLILARQDTNKSTGDGWLPVNIVVGLQRPLTLQTFSGPVDPTTGLCNPQPPVTNTSYSNPPTIYTETAHTAALSDLLPGTNCVDTDTGLPANAVTSGLITWTGSVTGFDGSTVTHARLISPASAGCPGQRTVTINNVDYDINNDTLTCFFTDNAATVADVSGSAYNYNGGQPVISADIYSSPRFYWVPVLKVKPGNGGSQHYAVVDFRPAFITDQKMGDTKATAVTAENGVEITNNSVTQLKVVFLNIDAIEVPQGGPVVPWIGAGPKLVRMTQ